MNTLVRGRRAAVSNADRLLSDAVRALVRWWRERREIERLSAFPDEMLKDIGISRGSIPSAVREGRRQPALPVFQTGPSKMAGL